MAAGIIHKYRLPFALLVYSVCFIILFPWYRSIFDSDNMGYYIVTKKLAAGDFFDSINGYWSPLHSWLALPFYKAGFNEFDSFRIVSGLAGAGILYVLNRLLHKLPIESQLITTTLFIAVLMTLAYAYYNQAADILVCLFLLAYTDIITEKDFFENRAKHILCGVIGCFSYFAKTYAFPFFLLHYTITQLVLSRYAAKPGRKIRALINWLSGVAVFSMLAFPWLYALYHKYHFITYGYSGNLNFHWAIYQAWGDDSKALYAISPGNMVFPWQDPLSYPWNNAPHPPYFSAPVIKHHFGILMKNIKDALESFNYISFTMSVIIPVVGVYAIKKQRKALLLIVLLLLLYPAPYLLVAIETRYLWIMGFLTLATGTFLIAEALRVTGINKPLRNLCWTVFFGSFLIFPLYTMKNRAGTEKNAFELATLLKAQGVQGSFLSSEFNDHSFYRKLAYLTDSKLYDLSREVHNYEELLHACRESRIQYLFYQYRTEIETQAFLNSELYKTAVKEMPFQNYNLTILKLY